MTEYRYFGRGLWRMSIDVDVPAHQFESVKIVSRAPDIMLIEGFVTEAEAEFLVQTA